MRYSFSKKYAGRARRRFCKNTRFTAPVDLILSGKRTLEEWVAVLNEERELEQNASYLNAAHKLEVDDQKMLDQ